MLIDYVASIPKLFSGWAIQGLSLQGHLDKMKAPGMWGSHLEIAAADTMFK